MTKHPAWYAERDAVASANNESLVALMRDYAIVLPHATAHLWRPTRRDHATLRGLDSSGTLEVLCTDGLVAWFRCLATGELFLGHNANFGADIKTLHSMTSTAAIAGGSTPKKPRKPRFDAHQAMLDLLK